MTEQLRWRYDERSLYQAECPNTNGILEIERVRIRLTKVEWRMSFYLNKDNRDDDVHIGVIKVRKRLSDAQRVLEQWVRAGSDIGSLEHI